MRGAGLTAGSVQVVARRIKRTSAHEARLNNGGGGGEREEEEDSPREGTEGLRIYSGAILSRRCVDRKDRYRRWRGN